MIFYTKIRDDFSDDGLNKLEKTTGLNILPFQDIILFANGQSGPSYIHPATTKILLDKNE